jgi:hypothetical protein
MSAFVRIPTAMTQVDVLLEALKAAGHVGVYDAQKRQISVASIQLFGRPLMFVAGTAGFIAEGMDLNVKQDVQNLLAQVNARYRDIMAERLRVAAEAERQRILEEQRKLVAERTAALLAQAKQRNFRVKEEFVNGKKRFTFVKMVIQ